MNKDNYAVIMAGGIGSRFWPVSTEEKPKQFIDILGCGKTLIQQTFKRLSSCISAENIFVVTNKRYQDLIKEQLPQIKPENILYEPIARNTAPCIAWACYKIYSENKNANIIVAPSDHLITDEKEFCENISKLLDLCQNNDALFTLGIKPTRPDTGYGYIQYKEQKQIKDKTLFKVKTFTEKPNLELAKLFVQSGDFIWNSGIFVWSAASIIKAIKNFIPEIDYIFNIIYTSSNTENEKENIEKSFGSLPKVSIDVGVMEKAKNVFVLPADFGWSDLGTWASLYSNAALDKNKNADLNTKTHFFLSQENIVHSDRQTLIRGLKDFIVVSTEKSLLICPKKDEQTIKDMLENI